MKRLIYALGYALRGIRDGFSGGRNFRIQVVVAIPVIVAGILLRLPAAHWCILLLCMALVLALELVNTAIELCCDFVHPDWHERIRQIKDMSAGAVLMAAIAAALCGLLLLLPPLLTLLQAGRH
jgi:diacylglycerol kinase